MAAHACMRARARAPRAPDVGDHGEVHAVLRLAQLGLQLVALVLQRAQLVQDALLGAVAQLQRPQLVL